MGGTERVIDAGVAVTSVCILCGFFLPMWVGHTYLWTGFLNHVYGRPIPKWFLKLWRLFTGLVIVALPLLPFTLAIESDEDLFDRTDLWTRGVGCYLLVCLVAGAVWFPAVTLYRYFRRTPSCVLAERTETVDYFKVLGPEVVGDGKYRLVAQLPLNDVFKVDFTELTLAIPGLPNEWDGLTLTVLSDLHFCGTPSRAFYEHVIDRLNQSPTPDLVILAGDYVDTETHHQWIRPLFSRLTGTEGRFAILGNHDKNHHPERVRNEIRAAGFTVLGNGWKEATVRGVLCVVVGHEGPWFRPAPDLRNAPQDRFRLCVSHSPDSFYWGRANGINLMLCGHVHGGQIRLPLIGSIFVPSVFGRRFDMGVFAGGRTVMVVGRGLSGKEPIRFRCHPQVLRLTLRPAGHANSH